MKNWFRWRYLAGLGVMAVGLWSVSGGPAPLPLAGRPTAIEPGSGTVLVQTAILTAADSAAVPRLFTGVIKAARTSDLGFKRSGRIEEIRVRSGQIVAAGDVLARLDIEQVTADLQQARAALAAAQARLEEAEAGPRPETIQAARAQLADARADVKLWRARLERQEELRETRAISAQEFDDSRFQFEAAEGRAARVASQLAELEAGTRSEQIALSRAEVAQWSASVERLEVEVADSYLRAPYPAKVARRDVDEGVVVASGAPIVRLVEHEAIEAWIGLPPEYL